MRSFGRGDLRLRHMIGRARIGAEQPAALSRVFTRLRALRRASRYSGRLMPAAGAKPAHRPASSRARLPSRAFRTPRRRFRPAHRPRFTSAAQSPIPECVEACLALRATNIIEANGISYVAAGARRRNPLKDFSASASAARNASFGRAMSPHAPSTAARRNARAMPHRFRRASGISPSPSRHRTPRRRCRYARTHRHSVCRDCREAKGRRRIRSSSNKPSPARRPSAARRARIRPR